MSWRKYLSYLSLLLIPLLLFLTTFFSVHKRILYMPFAATISSFIFFCNFPSIVLTLHTRPIYYDDLIMKDYEDDSENIYDDSFRKRFQNIFRWTITVTSSLMAGVMVDVWYMRYTEIGGINTQGSILLILGVTGGIVKLYSTVQERLGNILMYILKKFKQREISRRRTRAQNIATEDAFQLGIQLADQGPDFRARDGAVAPNISSPPHQTGAALTRPLLGRSRSDTNLGGSGSGNGNGNGVRIVAFKPAVMNDIFN